MSRLHFRGLRRAVSVVERARLAAGPALPGRGVFGFPRRGFRRRRRFPSPRGQASAGAVRPQWRRRAPAAGHFMRMARFSSWISPSATMRCRPRKMFGGGVQAGGAGEGVRARGRERDSTTQRSARSKRPRNRVRTVSRQGRSQRFLAQERRYRGSERR